MLYPFYLQMLLIKINVKVEKQIDQNNMFTQVNTTEHFLFSAVNTCSSFYVRSVDFWYQYMWNIDIQTNTLVWLGNLFMIAGMSRKNKFCMG